VPELVIRRAYEANAARVERLVGAGADLLHCFAVDGMRAVPLKGLHSLLAGTWRDRASRTMVDLDILVDAGAAACADELVRDAAAAILARTGAKVTLIKDSPGFIAQRMVAMIANLGCEMAMIGIASAQHVDTAMTLGLNYPRGPLALADWLGAKNCHEILVQLQAITGDDRYRPSQWLRRRAQLGLSATTVE
jgi:hypothetical protein